MSVLLLNSAQSKYPLGSDPWIQGSIKAISSLAEHENTILCSTDPSPWSLVTYLAGKTSMNIKLIVKAKENAAGFCEYERLLNEYALEKSRTSPLFLGIEPRGRPKRIWQERDMFALGHAGVVYPVSIRPGGRLGTLLSAGGFGTGVRNDFRIEWTSRKQRASKNYTGINVYPFPPGNWLVHWTRASQGPWPGEKAWEFYRDLLARPGIYVRSAGETLIRIIADRKIRGSSRRLHSGKSAVAFTSLKAENAVQLMRWRKRFVQYTFEPYGLGIKLDVIKNMGARRVEYENTPSCAPADKLFSQSPGRRGDWIIEKEWRIRGDLPLNGVERDDIIVIVPDETAAELIRPRIHSGLEVHTLLGD